jgi:GNAT superfamily N-acetyltransferase
MTPTSPSSASAVRRGDVDDARRLAELRYRFRAAEDPVAEPRAAFLRRCERWMRERLASEGGRWRCWVAEEGGRLCGHVWVARIPKVPNPVDEPEAHAYLTNMFVEPDRRGRGLGSALLEAALAWCRREGIGSVVLWPTERSRPLYRRFGFASGGVRELEVGAGEGG